jgi:hypothetical protein
MTVSTWSEMGSVWAAIPHGHHALPNLTAHSIGRCLVAAYATAGGGGLAFPPRGVEEWLELVKILTM